MTTRIRELMGEFWWQARLRARQALLIAKHRPFIKCPFCKGKGGVVSGYEEPEWSECSSCYAFWEKFDDCGMDWAVGRLPLLWWIRANVANRMGHWEATRLRYLIRCKLGFHRWVDEGDLEPGLKICCFCFESKTEPCEAEQPTPTLEGKRPQ